MLRIRQTLYSALLCLLAGIGSHYAARAVYSQTLSTTTRVALTAVQEVKVDGKPLGRYQEAFRRDGSRSVAGVAGGATTDFDREFVNIAQGQVTLADAEAEVATVQRLRRSALTRMATFPTRCIDALGLPPVVKATCEETPEQVLGYRVMRARYETVDGMRGTRTQHEWMVAPELNYFPLQQKRWVDGRLREERTAISVTLGEPDAALFSVPSHYRLVDKVSDLVRITHQRRSTAIDPSYLTALDRKWERESAAILRGE